MWKIDFLIHLNHNKSLFFIYIKYINKLLTNIMVFIMFDVYLL